MGRLREKSAFWRVRWVLPALWIVAGLHWTSAQSGLEGDAYWGSFGDRSGRLEGVFLKTGTEGVFIGFDEESETAAFSFDIDWESEGVFVLEGFAQVIDSPGVRPTRGTGRTFFANEGVLLESALEEVDLKFEAFAKSSGRLNRYRLEGEVVGELIVVRGAEGRSFALFLEENGFVYGGAVDAMTDGSQRFETTRGDQFHFGGELSSVSDYALADGRRGRLGGVFEEQSIDGETGSEPSPIGIRSIWSSYRKPAGNAGDSLHFILEGEGPMEVDLTASVAVDLRDSEMFALDGQLTIKLYRLDEQGDWNPVLSSGPLIRIKAATESEFDLVYAGLLPATLSGATYLVEVSGLWRENAVVDVLANFEDTATLEVVNGSIFYYCDGQGSERSLGFELEGEGTGRALVRNVGPGLAYSGVEAFAENPALAVFRDDAKSWINDDWADSRNRSGVEKDAKSMGAFPLPDESRDAAMSLSIGAGIYDAMAVGAADRVGFEIVELYFESDH